MLSQSCVFRKSKNFTSDFGIRIPPTVPINHYSRSLQTETDTWKTSKTRVLSCHPMLMAFNDFTRSLLWTRWFTHSDWRCSLRKKTTKYDKMQNKEQAEKQRFLTLVQTKTRSCPTSNYELFNHSNVSIRYWSWNYRGCWHQTGPPMDPR